MRSLTNPCESRVGFHRPVVAYTRQRPTSWAAGAQVRRHSGGISVVTRVGDLGCGVGYYLIRLLRLRLHMVRDDKPVAVDFLVDISDKVVELGRTTILHILFAAFLTHLPREVAVDVNMLV